MVDTATLNNALAGGFLLVDFSLRSWGGTKTNRSVSNEVIAQHGATKDAGRFVTNLLASADVELKVVKNRAGAISNYIYSQTLPWSSNNDGPRRGERLLAATQAIEFLKGLTRVKKEYDLAVGQLAAVWDQRVATAVANLSGIGNAMDYPNASEIPAYFGITIDIKPVPSMADFSRTSVPPEVAQALGQRIATQAQTQMVNALDDLKERLLKELQRVAKQLGKAGAGEKTHLFDSLVTNMQNMVSLIKTMNVTGNPELAALAEKIETQLLSRPVEAYRNSTAQAAETAKAAEQIALEATLASVWSP